MSERTLHAVPQPASGPTPLSERDDDALMTLAVAGSTSAFEVLVGRHLPGLTRFCAKLLGDAAGGEDVAQEVLVQLWEERGRYRCQQRLPVFLLTLARNRCLNRMRGERRREARAVAAAAGVDEDATTPAQLDALLEGERRRIVRRALLELPPLQREALLLRFDQGLPYPEIARVIGRSEEAVRSRVHHGLRMLREQVAGGDEP